MTILRSGVEGDDKGTVDRAMKPIIVCCDSTSGEARQATWHRPENQADEGVA